MLWPYFDRHGWDERFDEYPAPYFVNWLYKLAESNPDMTNDKLRYYIPEFWPTNLIITLNIREFRHILKLRTTPDAFKEFQTLARSMFDEVPEQFRYLLSDCVHEGV